MLFINFLNRKLDDIILLFIGIIIGLLINNLPKIIKFIVKYIRTIFKYIKRKLKGEYTLNELCKFEKLPENKLTKRQIKALYYAKIKIKHSMKSIGEISLPNINELMK